jgi:uncharacterized protein (DUF2345 family)
MSTSTILAGTPAGVVAATAQVAAVANTVVNPTTSVNILQSNAAAGIGINMICAGETGISVQQTFVGVGAGIQMDAQGDNGIVLNATTGPVSLNGQGEVGLTSAADKISITSTTSDIDLAASGTINLTGGNAAINVGAIGLFTAPPVAQQTQAVGPAPLGAAGAGAAVLEDTTFGNGANKYNLPQVIAALQAYGILA